MKRRRDEEHTGDLGFLFLKELPILTFNHELSDQVVQLGLALELPMASCPQFKVRTPLFHVRWRLLIWRRLAVVPPIEGEVDLQPMNNVLNEWVNFRDRQRKKPSIMKNSTWKIVTANGRREDRHCPHHPLSYGVLRPNRPSSFKILRTPVRTLLSTIRYLHLLLTLLTRG